MSQDQTITKIQVAAVGSAPKNGPDFVQTFAMLNGMGVSGATQTDGLVAPATTAVNSPAKDSSATSIKF